MSRKPNRLARETSPYLLQHAHNPVDWYPWGDDAFERARQDDKPLMLSVGYSACHWCHVMERESFDDEETAAILNERFVPVKVDREERPDIDSIYMEALQAMTGSGGWPMTVFITPTGEPFYAGTYFPKEARFGVPSFKHVLMSLGDAWRENRDEIVQRGAMVVGALGSPPAATMRHDPEGLSEDLLVNAHSAMRTAFDGRWGGFGSAPKFPPAMALEVLLRTHLRGWERSLDMARRTLDAMAAGGIHDQLGGGFHRYSTDRHWLVPHFEKMLYDNALLARAYTQAWLVTGQADHERVARSTLDYLLRDMRHPGGAFFSSQDADTDGVEGASLVWSWNELVDVAGEANARALGASPEGNWEGVNVLHLPDPGTRPSDRALTDLLDVRNGRPRPATDDKILAAWNGYAISALAYAGRSFQEPSYTQAAATAADFVLSEMSDPAGGIVRAWREGRRGELGFLDDQAAIGNALLDLYEATFDPRWFSRAREIADVSIASFADPDGSGFFMTRDCDGDLVLRPRDLFDNATPSGNSMAATFFIRLSHLTGSSVHEGAAVSALSSVAEGMLRSPLAFPQALSALDMLVSPFDEIAISGDPSEESSRDLIRAAWSLFLPNSVIAAAEPGSRAARTVELTRDRPLVGGGSAAYVCEDFACDLPITDPAEFAARLSGTHRLG